MKISKTRDYQISSIAYQGFMQKEKVNIDGEKNAQINIAPKRFQHKNDTRL